MIKLSNEYSEDKLVEQPAIKIFTEELGYEYYYAYDEKFGADNSFGRTEMNEVMIKPRLKTALEKLNPDVQSESISLAIEELTKDMSLLEIPQANQEIYNLIKNGIVVSVQNENEEYIEEKVRVIDFNEPENNDFIVVSQFWVSGELYKRRADLICFVNGLPLIFIELKAFHKKIETAYYQNLKDYKQTIPQLFWYNAFIILSNGSDTQIGTITSPFEHFNHWKKINDEGEQGKVSLETLIKGTCNKKRFVDILENFILYDTSKGKLEKLVSKYHQYFGVNNAIESFENIKENKGKLGVFWHTQGSGKSYSMIFYCQKILRKFKGNWTFLIITDRVSLDIQIYENFQNVGAVIEEKVQAKSCEHLQELLTEDHRMIFTLIHKFKTEQGEVYPKISDRDDIIIITDEAHRTQYDVLALNMRNALPKAAFLAFTGTPLIDGEEKTKETFGDYVSIFNFKQSIDDGATVPLYYENRIPELQLDNDDLNEDINKIIEEAELDEKQENKLAKEFAREYHLITRNDRLEKIAEDIVTHFINRGNDGKAMIISIDKLTTVKMYDKVQKYRQKSIKEKELELQNCDTMEYNRIKSIIQEMKNTDMAVVISSEQNEEEKFKEHGLDIIPHRIRMKKEDLDKKFKNPDSNLKIVFICNMWLTGFDVPSLTTLYLDKPLRNHTLMQAIARANRVFREKNNGLIVDYIGVFRNLQKALAIYATEKTGDVLPVQPKEELIKELETEIKTITDFCVEKNISINDIVNATGLEKLKLMKDAVDIIIAADEDKKKYLSLSGRINVLFKAILPDTTAKKYYPVRCAIVVIAEKIRALDPEVDISEVMKKVEELLDESIKPEDYIIDDPFEKIDLSKIDFNKLKDYFNKNKKNIQVEKLKGKISSKLKKMIRLNPSRINFLEKFQQLIEAYNYSSKNIELFFEELIDFAQNLNEEEKRTFSENLTEEELAIFDLLYKEGLSEKETNEIKKIACELLAKLKTEKLVIDWRKKQEARAGVYVTIEKILDIGLPQSYDKNIFILKCEQIYRHIYDSYFGAGKSVYA